MRLGIGSYTFAWAVGVPGFPAPSSPLTPIDLLARASAAGVRVVQIADNLPLHVLTTRELDTLRDQAGERGITLEIGTRGIASEHLRRYLQIAERLGARLLRVVFDTANHHPALAEIVDALVAIAPEAEKHDVMLAIENHDRFKAETLREIFGRVNHSSVGLCFDTANSLGCMEGAEQVLATLGALVVNVHLKDVHVSRLPHLFGFVIEGRPAGHGDLDIPKLIAQVRTFGRDPNVILELWPAPESTVAATIEKEALWADQSIRYLRQMITD